MTIDWCAGHILLMVRMSNASRKIARRIRKYVRNKRVCKTWHTGVLRAGTAVMYVAIRLPGNEHEEMNELHEKRVTH
jgi:hypothetical protein